MLLQNASCQKFLKVSLNYECYNIFNATQDNSIKKAQIPQRSWFSMMMSAMVREPAGPCYPHQR